MRLTNESFRELIDDLNNNQISNLDLLDYNGADLTQDRLKELSEALKKNTSVKEIEFPGMGGVMEENTAKIFAEMLTQNRHIKEIYLHFIPINGQGAIFIKDAILSNDSIKLLSLPGVNQQILNNIKTSLETHPKLGKVLRINGIEIAKFFEPHKTPTISKTESNSIGINPHKADNNSKQVRAGRFFIDMRNTSGPTLYLHNASLRGNENEMIDLIVNQKADPKGRIAPDGWTSLHAAASNGHINAVKLLLTYGACVNSCANDGNTPLHLAAHNGYKAVVAELLNHGASVDIKNQDNNNAYECIEETDIKNNMLELFYSRKNFIM